MKKTASEQAQLVPVLRTCNADMTAYGGFKWTRNGRIEAPDWKPSKQCGHGLHGLLRGLGDGTLLCGDSDAVWMVVLVDESLCVELDGKVKFPWAIVDHCGDRMSAVARLVELGCDAARVVGGTATAGDRGTATAGDRGTATAGVRGTATAGDEGTATAGDEGTATAGDRGTATAGVRGTATAGDEGTATAGDRGTATAGEDGTATAGDRGTATAGDEGTATAGDRGTATAGVRGTATAGDEGTATAGDRGILNIRWWDRKNYRYRIATFYVGEDDIQPNTKYRADENGRPVAA